MHLEGGAPATALQHALLCQVDARVCALPLAQVIETMRPLALTPLAGLPPFVRGLAIVRGSPTAVVDARRLLGDVGADSRAARWVTLRVDDRSVALEVDSVIGVRALASAEWAGFPPLVNEAASEAVAQLGRLDGRVLLLLRAAQLVPESAWAVLEAGARA